MKKVLLITFALVTSTFAFSQMADSVATSNSVQDVFYNLNDGQQTNLDRTSWDIAFTTKGFDVSIVINENQGVSLYKYSSDTSDWNSVDTNGFNYAANQLFNSNEDWSLGAFCNMGVSHPDYGWGVYTSSNHHVYGSKIFIIKTLSETYQIMIKELTVGGEFKFKIATIGGGSTKHLSVNKNLYSSKGFFYYDLGTEMVLDAEPVKNQWHLLFTKFHAADQSNYLVSGVKINQGLEVAERSGVSVLDNDTNGLNWNSNITEIGYDWKTFNLGTFSYDITSDLSYFVKNDSGDVWKIWFTAYGGGQYNFNTEKIGHNASITNPSALDARVYPNPSQGLLFIDNKETERATVEILNMQAQVIQSFTVGAQGTTETHLDLPSGIYFLKISAGFKSYSQRLIIE
ncbi:MAG: T9SS type A sorting domain-containing protein [Bacteroidia bacterium]